MYQLGCSVAGNMLECSLRYCQLIHREKAAVCNLGVSTESSAYIVNMIVKSFQQTIYRN